MNTVLSDAPVLDATADLVALGTAKGFDRLADLDARLGGTLVPFLEDQRFEAKAGTIKLMPTFGKLPSAKLAIVGLGDGSAADLAAAAGAIGKLAREQRATSLAADLGALTPEALGRVSEFLAIGNYVWDRFQKASSRKPALADVALHGTGLDPATGEPPLARAAILARWQAFARDLVNLPADELYPETLAAECDAAADPMADVTLEVWDHARCKDEGLVGIEAVGRGSDRKGRLIHLTYRPSQARDHIALVGKGVTFDAGGLSLKPSSGMQTMRCDMGGAATMLATFFAAAELGLPVAIDCFVPAVENLVSGSSYKLGDILTYRNGVSVEIHNTDAEGRLVLADALCLASEVEGVSTILDAATLTGAMVIALGPEFAGVFTDDDGLATDLVASSEAAVEGLWRMPLYAPYKRMLKGTWSTIKNVGGREGGSITAALFLQHFVGKGKRWAHLDIAGPAFFERPIGPYAPGGTGLVVRSLVTWIDGLG